MLGNSVYFDKKNNENIEGVSIFENTYLYTAYSDDSKFLLKNLNSIKELLNAIEVFSSFTCLKPNLSKYGISGIGAVKGVTMAVCGIKRIDLTKKCLKILGIYYLYNQILQTEENLLRTIKNMGKVLKMSKIRNLTLEGKIIFSNH